MEELSRRRFLAAAAGTAGALTLGGSVLDAIPALAATPSALVKGLMLRDATDVSTAAYPPNIEARWADLQTASGGGITSNNVIDKALLTGKPFRVRLMCGKDSPAWLLTSAGSIPYIEPQSGAATTVPKWWTTTYRNAYNTFVSKLATKYDGKVSLFFISGPMTYYAEPCIRGLTDASNRSALASANFNVDKDKTAIKASLDSHRAFRKTRSAMSFNTYQEFIDANNYQLNEAITKELMTYGRTSLGSSFVLQNNSISSDDISKFGTAGTLYYDIKSLGKPFSFQTATLYPVNRVGNLQATIQGAADNGAHAVELPSRYNDQSVGGLDAGTLASLDQALKLN